MGVACLEFRGENFRAWLKNREIRASFLPRKFPAIRYLLGSSGINGTQIFACYCDRVLGHRYLLWLKNFAVPFLPLDPSALCHGLVVDSTFERSENFAITR